MNDAIDIKKYPKRRIRKIRRLIRREPEPAQQWHRIKIITSILLISVICITAAFMWRTEEIREHIKRLAMNQFQLYLHGRCAQ